MSNKVYLTCSIVTIVGIIIVALVILYIPSDFFKQSGYQGLIYHEETLIAKTACTEEIRFYVMPDTLRLQSGHYYYGWKDIETYVFMNDGNYRIERKQCLY